MSLIPLKDRVTITEPGSTDAWGVITPGASTEYSARIDERTKVVKDQNGAEVVSNTQIMINGKVSLDYDYTVTYTDMTGTTVAKNPLRIELIKNISSKPLFTVVNV